MVIKWTTRRTCRCRGIWRRLCPCPLSYCLLSIHTCMAWSPCATDWFYVSSAMVSIVETKAS